MSSLVPVAMAMLPEKVEQALARAVASPEFWMVVVPEMLQAAAAMVVSNVFVGTRALEGRRTRGGANGSQRRQGDL